MAKTRNDEKEQIWAAILGLYKFLDALGVEAHDSEQVTGTEDGDLASRA
jgi:hypothetical protein